MRQCTLLHVDETATPAIEARLFGRAPASPRDNARIALIEVLALAVFVAGVFGEAVVPEALRARR